MSATKTCMGTIARMIIKHSLQYHKLGHQEGGSKQARLLQRILGMELIAKEFKMKVDVLTLTYKIDLVQIKCYKAYKLLSFDNDALMFDAFVESITGENLDRMLDTKVLDFRIVAWFDDWFDKQYISKYATNGSES